MLLLVELVEVDVVCCCCSCSSPYPHGQTHLHHHTLPGLCFPEGGRSGCAVARIPASGSDWHIVADLYLPKGSAHHVLHAPQGGPLNEDVFAARSKEDLPIIHKEIKNLQAKKYKLFLQPVHNNGSSGYGSLGSNGSHEHYSVDSSCDSNGNLWEDSHLEPQICADVKSWGQQAYLESSHILTPFGKSATAPFPHTRAEVRGHEETRKQAHIPSHQQINSVDSIIRYLEGCGPHLKRKSKSRSIGTSSSSSSTSEDDTPTTDPHTAQASSDSDYVMQPVTAAVLNRTRTGKPNKHKRPKPKTSSDSYASPPEPPLALPRPYSAWPSSESSNPLPQFGLPHPPISPPQAPMGTLQTPYFTMLRSQPGVDQVGKQQQAWVCPMVLQPDQNPNSNPQNFQQNLQQNVQQNLPHNFQFMQSIQNMQTPVYAVCPGAVHPVQHSQTELSVHSDPEHSGLPQHTAHGP
ncbi:period circadian protein homolog 3 [Salvelinus alpinus]